MNLLDNFQRYIRRNELAAPEDFILLTVSGGVDSMVMLSLFVRSGYRVGVAHCNFQLRGVESEEDEELVRREAEKYGVPWYNKRFDTKGEMERTGESMEMAARRLRYAWFDELSREHGYTVVAIAHHIDDSIETFFINLLRGTGLRGLTGITTHAGKLIRPLMFASRKDILEYAVAQHIPYREDSSNRSTKYLRNKIRLGLVPRIKEISPKFTDLMRQNIGRLTDAQLFINHGIQRIREEVITTENGIDTIHIDRIDRAFPLNFVIFELLNSTYSFKGDVSDALVRALEQNSGTGKRFYSKSHVAYIDRGRIMVTPIPADDPCQVQVEAGASLFNAALKSSTSSFITSSTVCNLCMHDATCPISSSPSNKSPSKIPFLARPFPNKVRSSSVVAPRLSASSTCLKKSFLTNRTGESCFNVSWVSPSFSRRHRSLNVK